MNNLRKIFIVICLFTTSIVARAESNECTYEKDLARLSDRQIMATARTTGVGKCKMDIITNGTTTWIQVSGVYEFKGPGGKNLVQEEYQSNASGAYDWAMQKLMLRFREKLIYCECAPN